MLNCLHQSEKNLVVTLVRGKVRFKDHPPLAKIIRNKIEKFGKVRWLWIGEDFSGWSLKYLIWNGAFDLWHTCHFEKIAIVGNPKIIRWMAKIITPFTPAKVKYFRLEDRGLSEEWIKN